MMKFECVYTVCMFVCYPHMIHILNQHDTGSALVHNSFTLTVRW